MIFLYSHSFKGHIYSLILEFTIIKIFNIKETHQRTQKFIQINWIIPHLGWIKCNIDGSWRGNLEASTCDHIFKDYCETFLEVFYTKVGITTSIKAQMYDGKLVIYHANTKGQNHVWLESDYSIAIQAFFNKN